MAEQGPEHNPPCSRKISGCHEIFLQAPAVAVAVG